MYCTDNEMECYCRRIPSVCRKEICTEDEADFVMGTSINHSTVMRSYQHNEVIKLIEED